MRNYYRGNLIIELTFNFALEVMIFTDELDKRRKYSLAKQLFKSATSIGANAREAQNAESKSDFIHKFKIAAKEVDETEYWLQLCEASDTCPSPIGLIEDIDRIGKVINKIVSNSKKQNNTR